MKHIHFLVIAGLVSGGLISVSYGITKKQIFVGTRKFVVSTLALYGSYTIAKKFDHDNAIENKYTQKAKDTYNAWVTKFKNDVRVQALKAGFNHLKECCGVNVPVAPAVSQQDKKNEDANQPFEAADNTPEENAPDKN